MGLEWSAVLEKEEIENAEETRQTEIPGEKRKWKMGGGGMEEEEDKLRSTPTRFQSNPPGPPAAAMPSCLGLACIN